MIVVDSVSVPTVVGVDETSVASILVIGGAEEITALTSEVIVGDDENKSVAPASETSPNVATMKVYAKGSVVVKVLPPKKEVINNSMIIVIDRTIPVVDDMVDTIDEVDPPIAATVERKDPTMTAIVLVIGNVVGDTIIAGMRVVGTNVVGINVVGK